MKVTAMRSCGYCSYALVVLLLLGGGGGGGGGDYSTSKFFGGGGIRRVSAGFGDYADLSFECPAKTTCDQVCVAKKEDCPIEMQCNEPEMLCKDGSCAIFCEHDNIEYEDLLVDEDTGVAVGANPCELNGCAPVACAKIVTTLDECLTKYASYYEYAKTCNSNSTDVIDEDAEEASFGWSHPAYFAVYIWLGTVSAGIILWCWYNHRINPVEHSTKVLQLSGANMIASSKSKSNKSVHVTSPADITNTYQTGYTRNIVGSMLYLCVLITLGGFHVLMGITMYQFYHHGNLGNDENILQSLASFGMVWNIGLVWTFVLKWPQSMTSLFLRRCTLANATQVAVFHETNIESESKKKNKELSEESMFPKAFRIIVQYAQHVVWVLMTLIYADPEVRADRSKGILVYCPVYENPDGSRYFVFLFRRYNFDEKRDIFVPGTWCVGKTFQEIAPKGISNAVIDDIELAFERALHGDILTKSEVAKMKYHVYASGLKQTDVEARYKAVGPNLIEMKRPTYLETLSNEITKPFYVYQFYILWIWVVIAYWFMACVNWGIITITVGLVSWFRYRGALTLYRLSHVTGTVTVLRDDKFQDIDQSGLVPGDIVKLEPGITHCDMVLLTGDAIIDESALTGEATPQAKAPIDPHSRAVYDPKDHKRQTISAGTRIQECDDALALVMNTASYTMKGELLRDIVAYRKYKPQHESDIPIAAALLATWGAFYAILVAFNTTDGVAISWSLGMVAFSNAFPALLPISFTVPVGISVERLAKNKIACSDSDSILISGKVRKAFFDKTGTLTKQGLDFISARAAESWDVGQWMSNAIEITMATCHSLTKSSEGDIIGNPVDRAMFAVTKASLEQVSGGVSAVIKDKYGKIYNVIRRFDFDHNTMTQSVIVRLPDGTLKAIVKGSGESISRKCQPDTIPDTFQTKLGAYSKAGIYQIAIGWKDLPHSILANNNKDNTNHHIADLTRDFVESNLEFVGVLNFSNQMRKETPEMIKQLNDANIQSVMVTGDNIFTGIYIAREAGIIPTSTNGKKDKKRVIIGCLDEKKTSVVWTNEDGETEQAPVISDNNDDDDDSDDLVDTAKDDNEGSFDADDGYDEDEDVGRSAKKNKRSGVVARTVAEEEKYQLAMSGEAWYHLLHTNKEYAIQVAPYIHVFGRCAPHEKVSVVDTFVDLGWTTLMCGDGGNDCGALKAAHVGIALCDGCGDASLVAPFTSLDKNIMSVVTLLKEGRATLASTLATYKYVIMYGQISSYNQIIMYKFNASFSGWQWTVMDGVWTVSFALSLPFSRPSSTKLSTTRPTSSILSYETVSSIVGSISIHFIFMAIALFVLFQEDWYSCRKWDPSSIPIANILQTSDNYEITVIFLITGFQCISSGMAFNFGYEFRRGWFRNYIFVFFAMAYTFIHFYITLVPGKLSCFWRVNCSNDNVVRLVAEEYPIPINNPFNTTIMPMSFRLKMVTLMVCNGLCVICYDYFVVNGIRIRRIMRQKQAKLKKMANLKKKNMDRKRRIGTGGTGSTARFSV